jgi:hypothetical protein
LSALKVQLCGVPVPTTVVGVETSTGLPLDGRPALQEPFGFPTGPMLPPSLVVVPASLVDPPVPVAPAPPAG